MDRVAELKARVDRNRMYRDERLAKTRAWTERAQEINQARNRSVIAFWCDICKKDVFGPAHKRVMVPKGQLPIAWHESRCPSDHLVVRYITDKGADPYYRRSLMMKRERMKMAMDLVQPSDPRFRILYPQQYQKMKEDRERQQIQQEAELVENDGDPNLATLHD